MNWKPSWKISASVVVLGVLMAGMYTILMVKYSEMYLAFNLIFLCILYTSAVIQGIQWFSRGEQVSVRQNITRSAAYTLLFSISFIAGGLWMGASFVALILIAVICILYGTIFSLKDFKGIFRDGWGTFLTIMSAPVLLIIWLVMFGVNSSESISRTMIYQYLLLGGVIYWILFAIAISGFRRYLLKQSS
ncbi:hypothetical protein ACE3MZ_21820 [Paenibacillus sp. WLX1005]|uniref:hypothetical protein n=1 Tax=Paenibacillus sp. WLX1005 TaxID=3243766 RepID=UPI003983F18B